MKPLTSELFSTVPTHLNILTGELVKLFTKTIGYRERDNAVCFKVEVMDGPRKGKWVVVALADLISPV